MDFKKKMVQLKQEEEMDAKEKEDGKAEAEDGEGVISGVRQGLRQVSP